MVFVHLTNGFGNNLFQYNAAKLLARFHGQPVFAIPPSEDYYAISDLRKLGFAFAGNNINLPSVIHGNDSNYRSLFNRSYGGHDFVLSGYFEDYTYYNKDIEEIKSWYPKIKKRENNDLVIHFRGGDRLFYKNEFNTKPTAQRYCAAIEQFNFEKMHIVTDMPEWKEITVDALKGMNFHHQVPSAASVDPQESVNYFNSLVRALDKYSPIVHKRTVGEDFDFIRSFDNILFQHGTLGWWASVLSSASKVGVYGPWRPWKGDSNKNLSKIPLEGWFQWS